jgi:hypothetical protein
MNFVVGAGVGVATGVGIAAATSIITGEPFDYSVSDFVIDAGSGAVGAGLLSKFTKVGDVWKLYKASRKLNQVAKVKNTVHAIKEAKTAMTALKTGAKESVTANAVMKLPLFGAKQAAHTIANDLQGSAPSATNTVSSGGATSDHTKTTTVLEQ